MTVGKGGEIENITIGKWGEGCSTNGHMTVGKEGGDWLEGKGEEGGGEGVVPWAKPWALKIS